MEVASTLSYGKASNKINNMQYSLLDEVDKMETVHSLTCGIWSENPQKPEWEVKLALHSDKPDDLTTRVGFIVVSNLDKYVKQGQLKTHSRHEDLSLPIFIQLLCKGWQFCKLELTGDFFNNAQLFPLTNMSNINPIELPRLKTLVVKTNMTLVLKGKSSDVQRKYFQTHLSYCSMLKERTAKNLWYLFNLLECPKLVNLEVADLMDWDDPALKTSGFYYWGQPLVSFIHRHSKTLKTLKTSALPFMQKDTSEKFSYSEKIPMLQDMQWWIKVHLKDFGSINKLHREIAFNRELEKLLSTWQAFLLSQRNLKTLVWISDALAPWTFTRKIFLSLCQQNSQIESLMLSVHGEKQFRKIHDLLDHSIQPKEYQIDIANFHGMTGLRILSIGTYRADIEMKSFTLSNLHLLPRTVENVQFYGVRVISKELETLSTLQKLKTLTIVQGNPAQFTEEDDRNGNVEGVTASVLAKLLGSGRSLEKLTIIGFPEIVPNIKENSKGGWLSGGFFGMCNPLEDHHIATQNNNVSESNATRERYSRPLQDILTFLEPIATIREIASDGNDNGTMTMLTIGDITPKIDI